MSPKYQNLVEDLVSNDYLQSPELIGAFKFIKRRDFVMAGMEQEAHYNAPLLIGYGQTISQPATVAFMLELLKPRLGDKVLDIGSGSGWVTALLAKVVGLRGQVIAVERIPELLDFTKKNVSKYNFDNVEFVSGDGSKGLTTYEPYDKIIVSAAAEDIPENILYQLKVGGRLVIPVGREAQSIILVIRKSEKDFSYQEFPGFRFVSLIND